MKSSEAYRLGLAYAEPCTASEAERHLEAVDFDATDWPAAIRDFLEGSYDALDDYPPVPAQPDAAPFELQREAAIVPKREQFENVKTRQTMLLSGLDCLPNQIDLFAADGERDQTTWPADAPEAGG